MDFLLTYMHPTMFLIQTAPYFVLRILKLAPSSIIWYLCFWRGVTIFIVLLSSIKYRLHNFWNISSRYVYLFSTSAFARWHRLLLAHIWSISEIHLDFINCSVWSSDNKSKILKIMLNRMIQVSYYALRDNMLWRNR